MQPSLFNTAPRFDGATFDAERDQARLTGQLERVLDILRDGDWHTVSGIRRDIWTVYRMNDPEPSISAQVRNLRKIRHGGYTIERRYNAGVYEFRLHV